MYLKLTQYWTSGLFQFKKKKKSKHTLAHWLSVCSPWIRKYSSGCGFHNKEMPNFLFLLVPRRLTRKQHSTKTSRSPELQKEGVVGLLVLHYCHTSPGCGRLQWVSEGLLIDGCAGIARFILWLLWDVLLLLVDYYWWVKNFFFDGCVVRMLIN